MALFGACLAPAPRDRCMTRGPAWLGINAFNGRRIFGSGAEFGNAEMNPGGGEWTDYGSVGSSENAAVGKIKDGQVLTIINMMQTIHRSLYRVRFCCCYYPRSAAWQSHGVSLIHF